ncbi:MAG: hypothetical protein WC458_00150 [Patescibacteria group bacterium]|jgi:hypothetical protein
MTKIVNCYATRLNCPVKSRGFNLKYFNLGLFAVIAFFGAFYLININNLTVQGFVLRDLKSQVAVLAGEKMANEEAVNSTQSYYSLNSRTKGLNMVAVGEVEYLSVNRSAVAKK